MSIIDEIRKRNSKEIAFGIVALVLALLGVIGLLLRLFNGDRAADFSSYVPWGLWVAAYIYFSGLSAGAFMIAVGAYVFNIRALARVGTLALFTASLTLVMGLLSIGLDLGHIERAIFVFIRPQFHSMMAWMVWMYTAYLILVGFMLRYSIQAEREPEDAESVAAKRRLRTLGIAGIPLVIAFAGGVGALFGTVIAREYWHSSLYPVFFLVGALTSGAALLTAITAFLWPEHDSTWRDLMERMRTFVLSLVLVETLLEWAEFSVPAWYQVGSAYTLIKFVLFGPYWYVFWLVHLLLGVAIPIVLLVRDRRPQVIGIASALVAITFFAVRLNLVIPGLITPELQGLERSYTDPIGNRLTYQYLPTFFEWQVLLGVLTIGVVLAFLGARLLPLIPSASRSPREVA